MAIAVLGLPNQAGMLDDVQMSVLGEAHFGPGHWRIGLARRCYYQVKPFLPRRLRISLRRIHSPVARAEFALSWPIEDRYARFQWEVMHQVLHASGQESISCRCFWPSGRAYAFVLTHDVETKEGQSYVRTVADLDENYGFRSSFNFVPERYRLDLGLIKELRDRGFEIGLHGLKHDGKLFNSQAEFLRRAERINVYLKELDAVGFRAPLTMRNPEWMQALQIEYDLSFFDTDPYEPMPGGTMSIWPFFLGRFVELPYTLAQDCTLISVLGETTPRIWLQKVDFIERYHGMVLVNTHPDYLSVPVTRKVYVDFLEAMRYKNGYWHALPREVARWWCNRANDPGEWVDPRLVLGKIKLDETGLVVQFGRGK